MKLSIDKVIKKKDDLLNEIDTLFKEYKELNKYLKNRTKQEAESVYYNERLPTINDFNEHKANYKVYTSLEDEMIINKLKRRKLVYNLQYLKNKIKKY